MINWEDCLIDQTDRAATLTCDGRQIVRMELGRPLLSAAAQDPARSDLALVDRRTEEDEIESRWRSGPLEITWRHSAELVWSMRIAVTNVSDEPVELVELPLHVAPGEDRVCWAVRSGAEASIAVLGEPDDTLWIDVVQGAGFGEQEEFLLGGVTLAPGQQHVTRTRTDWVTDLSARSEARHAVLPHWDWHHHGSTVVLDHPDLAVVQTDGHETEGGQTELEGAAGARTRTRLVGPRGTIDIAVGFAPSVDEAVADQVHRLRSGWGSSRQGPVIPEVAQAVLAQHALGSGESLLDGAEVAAAVEGAVARFRDKPSVLAVVLLAQQAVATGDRAFAEDAVMMAAQLPDVTGFTLAWMRLVAAATLTGADLEPFLVRQRQLLGDPESEPGLALLVPGAEQEAQRIARRLGCGLRGSRIGVPAPISDAYDVALLSQWIARRPDGVRPEQHWAVEHGEELVFRHRTRLCHLAATGDLPPDALVWLLLAEAFN